MNLYLVQRIDAIGYDEYDAHLVRAENEKEARKFASARPGDEGVTVWLDENTCFCKVVDADGRAGVLLSSFNAG